MSIAKSVRPKVSPTGIVLGTIPTDLQGALHAFSPSGAKEENVGKANFSSFARLTSIVHELLGHLSTLPELDELFACDGVQALFKVSGGESQKITDHTDAPRTPTFRRLVVSTTGGTHFYDPAKDDSKVVLKPFEILYFNGGLLHGYEPKRDETIQTRGLLRVTKR
jgi:hypothetical protein